MIFEYTVPSIVLLMNRTAPSQKPRLRPWGCPLFVNGKRAFERQVPAAVNIHKRPDLVGIGPTRTRRCRRRARVKTGPCQSCNRAAVPAAGTPQTLVGPMNEVNVGSGAAQFVTRLTE